MLFFFTEKELSPTQKIHNISNEHLKLKATGKKEGLNSHDALDDTKATVNLAFALKDKIGKKLESLNQ